MLEKRTFKKPLRAYLDAQEQEGTLAEAVIEVAMNAVDAGATRFDTSIDDDVLMMEDNGNSFRSWMDVERFFKEFGQAHEGDANYGKSRMGRGQIFVYGRNFWRSGKLAITVDVRGLRYKIEEMSKDAKGCKILVTLYDPLSQRRLADLRHEVSKGLKYLEIPAFWHDGATEERLSMIRDKGPKKTRRKKADLGVFKT